MDPYSEAHLFVAAIRLLHHQKKCAPAIGEVASLLHLSDESAHAVCRRLAKLGIVDTLEDPFTLKLAVANHLAIEELPKEARDDASMAKELEQFLAKKKDSAKKVEAIQAELEKKKQSMFKDLEQKLKKNMREADKNS